MFRKKIDSGREQTKILKERLLYLKKIYENSKNWFYQDLSQIRNKFNSDGELTKIYKICFIAYKNHQKLEKSVFF